DDFVLIRWPEGCQAIVEMRDTIHKICSVMRSPQRVLPVDAWADVLWFADGVDRISAEPKLNGKIRDRTPDAGSG
ncbi:hypothetical protein, partial [Escherichia coli]|uniref:hypothetical protein n=1 Tax=Escherichia coli TaxID=562 RepID=UPI000BDF2E57